MTEIDVIEKCVDIDIQNDVFRTKKQGFRYYLGLSTEKIFKIYKEYYGDMPKIDYEKNIESIVKFNINTI